jgi:hypothetical protein
MGRWMERFAPGRSYGLLASVGICEQRTLRACQLFRRTRRDWYRLRVRVGGRVAGPAGGRMTAPDLQTVVRGCSVPFRLMRSRSGIRAWSARIP